MPRKKDTAQKLLFDGLVQRSSASVAGLASDDEEVTNQEQQVTSTDCLSPVGESVEPTKPAAAVTRARSTSEEVESDAIGEDTMIKIIASRQRFPPNVTSHETLLAETAIENVGHYPRQQQRAESSVMSDEDRAIKIINSRQQQQQQQQTSSVLLETAMDSVERKAPQGGDGESKDEDDDEVIKIRSRRSQQPNPPIGNVPHATSATAQLASAPSLPTQAGTENYPERLPSVKQRSRNTAETVPGPGAVASRDISQTLLDDDTTRLDSSKSVSLSGSTGNTRQIIAAELVSSEIDASARRRIVAEARQQFLQEVTPAQVVEFVHGREGREFSNEIDEDDDDEGGGGRVNWSRRIMVAAPVVLVAIVVLVVFLSMLRRPTQFSAIEPGQLSSTAELYEAVDAYMVAISTTSNPGASTVAQRYGWPIGAWDVSRITNFTKCFDLNRDRTKLEYQYADDELTQNFFDADLSDWDVSSAETMHGMVRSRASL